MEKEMWNELMAEYIGTDATQRQMAEKYGVSLRSVEERSRRGGWAVLKKEKREENPSDERRESILKLTDDVTNKIGCALSQLETSVVNGELVDTGLVDTHRLRQIVQSIKDLNEIAKGAQSSGGSQQAQNRLIDVLKEAVLKEEADVS